MPDSRSDAQREAQVVPAYVQQRLSDAGLRRTLATRAVLGVFLARTGQGFTHAQVLAALQARVHPPNRVTLYRLLDRLAACGVLNRHSDEQRSWRFALAPAPQGGGEPVLVPRFECQRCHRELHLPAATAQAAALNAELLRALADLGHVAERMDLAVQGTCAPCSLQRGGGAE